MARILIYNVIEKMCIEKLKQDIYKESIDAFSNLNRHKFQLTLHYWKNTNDPHYNDLPDKLVFKGTYKELYEKVYGSGLIESEYAFASKLKKEEKYDSLIQIEIKEVEVLE